MSHRLRHGLLFLLGLLLIVSTVAHGQQPVVAANEPSAVAAPLPQGEVEALLAPIATVWPIDTTALRTDSIGPTLPRFGRANRIAGVT
jgi:hypothetical protein